MLSNKIFLDKSSPPPYIINANKEFNNIFQRDTLLNSIYKLSSILRNYTKAIKSKISKKNIEISFIENNLEYSYTIVNNIIKHNYSYEQLQSLGESLVQIKEKNNNNKLNLLKEENYVKRFFEQSDKLIKSIIINIKQKLEKKTIQLNQHKSLTPNSAYNNSINEFRNGAFSYNLGNANSLYNDKDKKKRNKSAENKENIQDNKNIKVNSIYNDKNNYLNLIHLTPPPAIYKVGSKYNNSLNKEHSTKDKINKYDNSVIKISKTKIINDNNIWHQEYETLKKKNLIFEKNILNLKKELTKYKKCPIYLAKKNLNLNTEISERDKEISFLSKENENLRKKLELLKSQKKMRNIKNKYLMNIYNNLDNLDKFNDMNNNTYHSFNFADNTKYFSYNLNDNNASILKEKEIKYLKQEKKKLEKYIKEQNNIINKNKYKENEFNVIKKKLNKNLSTYIDKKKKFEIEIHKLNERLSIEMKRNEELNDLYENQKIKYEHEISEINDKRAELSKLLANKNSEIIQLQKELVLKNKEFEEEKLSIKNNNEKKDINQIKIYYEKKINEKNKKEIELNNRINIILNEKNILYQQNEKNRNEIIDLKKIIKNYKNEINLDKIQNDKLKNYNNLIKKLKDENEGLKEFVFKKKDKEEKILEKYQNQKDKIILMQKENEKYKNYFIENKIDIPFEVKIFKIKDENKDININNNMLMELNEAKKEINILKKKNEELFNELENKKFENEYGDNYSEGKVISNYEEEFDLKKMAKGAKEKNRSQDINIDYPGAQQVKEKYRELDFYYNSLEELVKKLLLNCTCTNKNKTYIKELCKIVGFKVDIIDKIINNKSKKGIDIFG